MNVGLCLAHCLTARMGTPGVSRVDKIGIHDIFLQTYFQAPVLLKRGILAIVNLITLMCIGQVISMVGWNILIMR